MDGTSTTVDDRGCGCKQLRGVVPYIAEWEWDDTNVEHIGRHGLRVWEVEDVWLGEPKFRRNRRQRAGSHQMIGPDAGGRYIAAFIRDRSEVPGLWRVITAREATLEERAWWEGS